MRAHACRAMAAAVTALVPRAQATRLSLPCWVATHGAEAARVLGLAAGEPLRRGARGKLLSCTPPHSAVISLITSCALLRQGASLRTDTIAYLEHAVFYLF